MQKLSIGTLCLKTWRSGVQARASIWRAARYNFGCRGNLTMLSIGVVRRNLQFESQLGKAANRLGTKLSLNNNLS